jgi:hypothetical protein
MQCNRAEPGETEKTFPFSCAVRRVRGESEARGILLIGPRIWDSAECPADQKSGYSRGGSTEALMS